MKNVFNAEEFMYRKTLRSFNEINVMSSWDKFFDTAQKDKLFLEQLLISSQSFYKMLNNMNYLDIETNSKKSRNIKETLFNYWNRSCNRTTPFGLFSSVGIGKFSESIQENKISYNYCRMEKNAIPDFGWLRNYTDFLVNKYYKKLSFSLNKATYTLGNKVFLMYCIDEDENEEISISKTPVYEIIQNLCESSFVQYSVIKESILKIYGKDYIELIDKFILSLIDNGILIFELDVL